MSLTRRVLFQVAGTAAVGFAAIAGSRFACRFVPRNRPNFFSLLEVAPSDATALRIGRLALAHQSIPSDLAGLEEAMRARPLLHEALETSCPRSRAELVREQCADDFRDGRTVELDGWLLSSTEASICAAKALSRLA